MAEPLSRQSIIAATRDLIHERGLDAVSLRQVGATLGVTAPALYAYVEDKQDLLRAVADDEFQALLTRFDQVAAADPLERTRGYCRAYIEHALERPSLFQVMFLFQPRMGAPGDPEDDLPSATAAFTKPAEALHEAIAAGVVTQTDPLLATLTIWTAIHGAAVVLLMGFDFADDDRARLIDSVIDTVVTGLTH